MNVPAVAVPHLPIVILELVCDELAADVTRLGRILAAMRSEAAPSSQLAAAVSATVAWTAPRLEVLYHCKHASQPGYVSPRLIGPLIKEDNNKGTEIWTPEYGKTFFLRHLKHEADTSYDYAFRKFRTSTCVILPQRPPCVQCDSEHPLRILNEGRAWSPWCINEPFTEPRAAPSLVKRTRDKGYSPMFTDVSWPSEEERKRLHVEPIGPKFTQVTPEDVAWGERQGATRNWVSAAETVRHEKKLFADIEAYRVRDAALIERQARTTTTTFKVVRRRHSAMGQLMKLYADVAEKMRGEEEVDVVKIVDAMPHNQALRYLRACSRWLIERRMVGKQARTLNDILDESRTFPN